MRTTLFAFNTHGGNHDLLNMMAGEVRLSTGLMVFRLNGSSFKMGADQMSPEENRLGIHAGDYETSLLLEGKPDWVDMTKARREFAELPTDWHWSNIAWTIDDISSTGIAGDATRASAAKGWDILREDGQRLAECLLKMSAFDISTLKNKKKVNL